MAESKIEYANGTLLIRDENHGSSLSGMMNSSFNGERARGAFILLKPSPRGVAALSFSGAATRAFNAE